MRLSKYFSFVFLPMKTAGGRSRPGTNVFLFWSGQGARNKVLLKWADENLEAETFRGILEAAQGNYRKMLAVMETCYSGSIGTYCEGLPGVLLLCSASSSETSHSDVMEDGIYLSNRFTRVFRSQVEANPAVCRWSLLSYLRIYQEHLVARYYSAPRGRS